MSGGFGAGFVKGAIYSLIGMSVVSLAAPLPPLDPQTKTQTDLSTPEGSGFNAERTDTNPVLPETDQSVEAVDTVQKPEAGLESPSTPIADRTSAEQPETDLAGDTTLAPPKTDEDTALLLPSEDEAPPARIPALGVPMPEIENPVAEIPVNRLPTIEPPATEVETPPNVTEEGVLDPEDDSPTATIIDKPVISGRALQNNKVPFTPSGKPLMSVILLDAGDEGLDRDVLLTFTFPVTFALDPLSEGATAASMKIKSAGFEVLAMAPATNGKLEKAENPGDFDLALQDLMTRLPSAVGLIDNPNAEIQQDRVLAEQVIEGLKKSGYGFLTYDIGLNSTNRLARNEGLASDIVFRILDQERESGAVIKRYLDRAVLEAGTTGHVIVLGRTYPETITALFSWAVSAKSATVSMAPVSAVLLDR